MKSAQILGESCRVELEDTLRVRFLQERFPVQRCRCRRLGAARLPKKIHFTSA